MVVLMLPNAKPLTPNLVYSAELPHPILFLYFKKHLFSQTHQPKVYNKNKLYEILENIFQKYFNYYSYKIVTKRFSNLFKNGMLL